MNVQTVWHGRQDEMAPEERIELPSLVLETKAQPLDHSGNAKKTRLLGMPIGTAANRLRKSLMFDLAVRLELNTCYRCSQTITCPEHLSIEHKEAWQTAADPGAAFFDLGNVTFSHLSCNSAAAKRTNKVYVNAAERKRQESKRHRKTEGWRKTVARRREKRRKARLVLGSRIELDLRGSQPHDPSHGTQHDW